MKNKNRPYLAIKAVFGGDTGHGIIPLRYSSTIPPAIPHHNLDGVELALASLDVLQQLAGVVQTVGDTDVEGEQ